MPLNLIGREETLCEFLPCLVVHSFTAWQHSWVEAARESTRIEDRVSLSQLEDMHGEPAGNYRYSPHLAQYQLYDRLVRVVHGTVGALVERELPLRVLEIGASHGGYTGDLLAAGCEVTVLEMSQPAVRRLEARYGQNSRLRTVWDPELTLAEVNDGYSLALCVSVLHHIPDYSAFLSRITRHLRKGGSLLTLQDPLWYPRLGRVTRIADRGAYLAWRVARGNVRLGVASMIRRRRHIYPEVKPGQIVYYHVVRQGVDEEQVASNAASVFERTQLFTYWSNHNAAVRRFAERAGLANTFGVRGIGFTG